ncbi:MAG: universal stress protein [Bacteroidales bacterium]|nr:universal stress protein [Bacteroidales bacterium]MCF8337256.1 universal stress protein [Bacteroidales bacterium]
MEKLLAAVDFSECSMNAFRHALNYARKLDADLTMAWVDPETFKFISSEEEKIEATTRAREAFDGIWKQYKNDLPSGELKYLIKRGQVYEEIVKTAVEEEADLIIAGTHGVSGFRDFWLGTNAFRLIMASPLPVLTIRESAPPVENIDNIVVPIDSTVETKQKNEIVALLAKQFRSTVHVISVYSSKMGELRKLVDTHTKESLQYFEQQNIPHEFGYREGSNVTTMALEYARANSADLIVIMTEQEIKASNLWMGPYAKQMVNYSEIPVLSIKPKELVRSLKE